ncbi:MAG: hypothetical protein ACE3JK_04900 [Sporolactobacillus sp.]
MTPDEMKTYLDAPERAIEDVRKAIYTEDDFQRMVDEVYKQLDPSWKKLTMNQKLIFGWSMNAPKMLESQNYLDEVLKPFINKLNKVLSWNIRKPDDFML